MNWSRCSFHTALRHWRRSDKGTVSLHAHVRFNQMGNEVAKMQLRLLWLNEEIWSFLLLAQSTAGVQHYLSQKKNLQHEAYE